MITLTVGYILLENAHKSDTYRTDKEAETDEAQILDHNDLTRATRISQCHGLSTERSGDTFQPSKTTGKHKAINILNQLPTRCTKDQNAISIYFQGRFGNQLFQYVSLLGIAIRSKLVPFTVPKEEVDIFRVFNLTEHTMHPSCKRKVIFKFRQKSLLSKIYQNVTEKMGYISRKKNVTISIYAHLASWRYFDNIKDELKRKLTFNKHVEKQADYFYSNLVPKQFRGSDYVKIGVHIRLSDRSSQWSRENYTQEDYLKNAANYYKRRFDKLLFIVCSDRIDIAERIFQQENVVFSRDFREEYWVDLAILARCDHSVITVGSFGWWAGWLAGGDVVYYRYFPPAAPGYSLDRVRYDYYPPGPPNWVPI